MLQNLKRWARRLKRDVHAVDPPPAVRACPGTQELSRSLLRDTRFRRSTHPDFVPVLGYVDDLIIVPLGIWLVVSSIPEDLMAEYRAIADKAATRPQSRLAATMIMAIWILGTAILGCIGLADWARPN